MRQNPHVRICGGPGSATTLVYPTSVRRRSRPGHRVRVGPRSRRRGGPTRPNTGTRQMIAAYKPPRPAGVRHARKDDHAAADHEYQSADVATPAPAQKH